MEIAYNITPAGQSFDLAYSVAGGRPIFAGRFRSKEAAEIIARDLVAEIKRNGQIV